MISIFAQTDRGRVRRGNEDSFLVLDTTSERLDRLAAVATADPYDRMVPLMVSDGMGGAAAGEVASTLAVRTAMDELDGTALPGDAELVDLISASLQKANDVIAEEARRNPSMQGMGATATLAAVVRDQVFLGQVGDSRAYLIRNGAIHQLTRDQSFVNQLVEAGKITEEEAEVHPRRNIILQALGNQSDLRVAVSSLPARKGDHLLLCSDGLTGMLRKEEIAAVIAEGTDLPEACRRLVAMANQRGGADNITIVLARFDDERFAGPGPDEDLQLAEVTPFSRGTTALSTPPEWSRSQFHPGLLGGALTAVLLLTALWAWLTFRQGRQAEMDAGDLDSLRAVYRAHLASGGWAGDSAVVHAWLDRAGTAVASGDSAAFARWRDSLAAALVPPSPIAWGAHLAVLGDIHRDIDPDHPLWNEAERAALDTLPPAEARRLAAALLGRAFEATFAYVDLQIRDDALSGPLAALRDSLATAAWRHDLAIRHLQSDGADGIERALQTERAALDLLAWVHQARHPDP